MSHDLLVHMAYFRLLLQGLATELLPFVQWLRTSIQWSFVLWNWAQMLWMQLKTSWWYDEDKKGIDPCYRTSWITHGKFKHLLFTIFDMTHDLV